MKIYNGLAKVFYSLLYLRSDIYSRFYFFKKKSAKNIPIIINNRNRLTFLKSLVDRLHYMGYFNITILDNDSTFEPLLKYYNDCGCNVVYLKENLGYAALSKINLYNKVRRSFFVYTDSDVVPIEECPDNFLEHFLELLKKYPRFQKVGFSLKIDDLPFSFKDREKVIDWESQYYRNDLDQIGFIADIDTTFALHRPMSSISVNSRIKNRHIRTVHPYEAYHKPWYNETENLTFEEKFYLDNVEIGTHWSKGLGQENTVKDFYLKKILKYLLKNGS